MLCGNAELSTAELSTDKTHTVFKIPFTETSEIDLGRKLKKK